MKSNSKIILLIALVLVIAIGVLIYFLKGVTSWNENYKMSDDDPYGTAIIAKLLENTKASGSFHTIKELGDSTLKEYSRSKSLNYVFIGKNYYADSTDINHLLDFTAKGNTAFISATNFPLELTALISHEIADSSSDEVNYYDSEVFQYSIDSAAKLNFFGGLKSKNDFRIVYNFLGYRSQYHWSNFDSTVYCCERPEVFVLGSVNGKINFIRIAYGRGNIFLHCTPIAFTNYFIISDRGRDYAERSFTVLNEGDIIWDEYNKISKYSYAVDGSTESAKGPLMFILSRDSLRWAWYLMLALLLLYIIFIGKRRQRIIPIIDPNRNTSLDYIKTIGKLYYQERNHRAVCLHKMKHFQTFLRNRYFILTTQRNDELSARIAMVSGVKKELINEIFIQFALIDVRTELTDEELIRFHRSLTTFYKECI